MKLVIPIVGTQKHDLVYSGWASSIRQLKQVIIYENI